MILRELIRQLIDLNNTNLRVVVRGKTELYGDEDFSIACVKKEQLDNPPYYEEVAVIEID